jgi:hypothetical protein
VPEGTTSLRLQISPTQGSTSAQLTAPDGERRHWSIGSDDANQLTEPMAVAAGAAGAIWTLHRSGDVNSMQVIGEGADVPQLLFQDEYAAEVCEAFAAAER